MLREYDPLLSVRWSEAERCWYLCCGGESLFSLEHADGTAVRNLDGHGTELLETLRRCDQRNRYRNVRRRLAAARRDHADADRRAAEETAAQMDAEARDRVRVMKRGVAPFVCGAPPKGVGRT